MAFLCTRIADFSDKLRGFTDLKNTVDRGSAESFGPDSGLCLEVRINNNNNLLLGSSITKSGLHRGPNTRYILYNDTIKIYKLELKPKYINNYNIYTTRIKKQKKNS